MRFHFLRTQSTPLAIASAAIVSIGCQPLEWRDSTTKYSGGVRREGVVKSQEHRRGAGPRRNTKPDLTQEESKRRQAYAWSAGRTGTDRGRFYVSMGSPDEIESQVTRPRRETWVYRTLGFTVTFTDLQPDSTNRPPGISPSLWIPLGQTSGAAQCGRRFALKSHDPTAARISLRMPPRDLLCAMKLGRAVTMESLVAFCYS